MTYLVTARKWRPMVFNDIIGQSHIATTLRNAIATNRLSHAYIFSGPRGVGKTTTARILAKAINCLHPNNLNPDNECDLCKEITEGRSVNVFEIDGASNRGVDEIRNLRESVRYGPAKGKYKVYIIDEVHMLTKEAFNALLKTLEEPPAHIMFIFATTEIHKVPLTILSRCQRFDFRRNSIDEITSRLRFIASEENISIDEESLFIIAKRADGSMRDAQSIFDQVISFCGEDIKSQQILSLLNIVDQDIYFRITEIIKSKNVQAGFLIVDEIINRGFDLREFLGGLMEHLRNILIACTTKTTTLIESSDIYRERYGKESTLFTENDLLRLIKIANDTDSAVRWSNQPRIKLEIGIIHMIKLDSSVEIAQLLEQIDQLKKNVNGSTENTQSSSPEIKNTETPIKGKVKASPPTLRAEQIVEPSNAFREVSTSYQYVQQPPTSHSGDILKKWSILIQEARRDRIHLGTMLGETSLLEISNDRLCIGCPDDFHLDALNLNRNRQYLQELAERVYGGKMQLETIITTTPANPLVESVPQTLNLNEKSHSEIKQHPVISALIKEFGVREVK